jgi:hypothetical protein
MTTQETETGDRKAAARAAIAAQLTGRTNRLFYVVVLCVALVGSSTAAQHWLIDEKTEPATWHLAAALIAVTVYELGAVAVSRFADQRRQLGERAIVARIASAALAGGAITAQYLGHQPDTGPAVFFAGVSATGYVIYLLEAAANRRDALRRDGKLADTPPAYGLGQWIRHFWITRRARALALANAEARLRDKTLPPLGRVASLVAAAEQVRAEKRLAAIEDALRTRIATGVDPTMAKIAVNTYDMGRVAAGIAAAADYPSLTRIITAELVPARLVKLDDAQGRATTAAASAIAEHVAGELAAVTRPPVVPAGVVQLPIVAAVPAAAAVPPPSPTETAPVPPAETETAPVPPAETEPRRIALEPVPPPLTSILGASEQPPVPTQAKPETAPVSEPAETEAKASPAGEPQAADQGGTDETVPETTTRNGVNPLAGVAPKLIPYMCKVIDSHDDWAVSVKMPPRHPEALNVPKILAAAGLSGKQLGVDIRTALIGLADRPETAERALRSRSLAGSSAS